VIPVDVLLADERRFGPVGVAPARPADHRVAALLDLVEEVVGREEREIAAEVAIALGRVELMCGDVFLMAREHDEAVGTRELLAAQPIEVVIGQEVCVHVLENEPAHEAAVVPAVMGRHTGIDVRAREIDVRHVRIEVPRVAGLVVVRLPRVGR